MGCLPATHYDARMDTRDGTEADARRVDGALREAARRIDAGEARRLLCHVLDRTPTWLMAHGDAQLDAADAARFATFVDARANGEPVAYLVGMRGFWTLDLAVTPNTLVPRADTERLVELALERIDPMAQATVADLGTGSGAVALALASERPRARMLATDASAGALRVAQGNARRLGLAQVQFVQGSWCDALACDAFDLIASNPPYIASDDVHLLQGDLRFEPASALASGSDGLDALARIAADAPARLRSGGWLLLEHGWEQGIAVRALLGDAGLQAVETAQDIEARDRVTLGRKA